MCIHIEGMKEHKSNKTYFQAKLKKLSCLTVIPRLAWATQTPDLKMASNWPIPVGGLWSNVIRKISKKSSDVWAVFFNTINFFFDWQLFDKISETLGRRMGEHYPEKFDWICRRRTVWSQQTVTLRSARFSFSSSSLSGLIPLLRSDLEEQSGLWMDVTF